MRHLLCALLLGTVLSLPAAAQSNAEKPAAKTEDSKPAAKQAPRLPANSVTHHTLLLTGRKLEITATAGALSLLNADGEPIAQIGFVAYTRDAPLPEKRPVTFALNGGPGSSSAWLQLGLLGPWRLHMDPDAARPSADAVPVENDDTWLDFTDLVFIDPVGTGFSKLLINTEENRKKYFSVRGDIASLSEAIRLWLVQAKRMSSPKYIVGESYAGFRGPRLVRSLAADEGVGIRGLVLISPVLDFGNRSKAVDIMGDVAELPTLVASMRAKKGEVSRAELQDAETYATTDYIADLLRGEDPAAVARRKARLAALTGLDPALLDRRHARIEEEEFLRETNRDSNAVPSAYDTTVLKPDPFPEQPWSRHDDSMTDALSGPFTSTAYDIFTRKLNWLPDAKYRMSNNEVFKAWDWGNDWVKPEAARTLRQDLAEDPKLRVLIAHGLFDTVTPYFGTQLVLNQIPASVGRARVEFEVYPGGHMFYSRDTSRQALRKAVEKLYPPE